VTTPLPQTSRRRTRTFYSKDPPSFQRLVASRLPSSSLLLVKFSPLRASWPWASITPLTRSHALLSKWKEAPSVSPFLARGEAGPPFYGRRHEIASVSCVDSRLSPPPHTMMESRVSVSQVARFVVIGYKQDTPLPASSVHHPSGECQYRDRSLLPSVVHLSKDKSSFSAGFLGLFPRS